jgi:hypothetical protein
MEAVDGVEEEEGADAFVEVVSAATEGVEFRALGEQFSGGQLATMRVQRRVALRGLAGGDKFGEFHGLGISNALQMAAAVVDLTSRWRGTAEVFRFAGFHQIECRPPSR